MREDFHKEIFELAIIATSKRALWLSSSLPVFDVRTVRKVRDSCVNIRKNR
jgi:hypothetical protein